jgi:transcriptional regulator with XRE-family HTH domain
METIAKKLRERAQQLGISNAEAARRIGLEERRYAHYVSGRREPDLATLVGIAKALQTTPNALLGVTPDGQPETRRSTLLDRLMGATQAMADKELEICVVQAEAMATLVGRKGRRGRE